MGKRLLGSLIISILVSGQTMAIDLPIAVVSGLSDWLEFGWGSDPAQGLTALPSLTLPMGGQSEALGTAFSALADDASFLEWNPAASATLRTSELAVFHNNWIADTKIDSAVYVSRFKDFGWAAGVKWLYVPFTEYDIFGERRSKGYYSEMAATFNASYNFNPGLYFDGFAVGANLKAGLRLAPDYADNAGQLQRGSGLSQSAAAIMIDLGCLTRFDWLKSFYSRERNFAIAAVIRHLGPPVQESALPTVAVLGLAYKPIAPLSLTLDLSQPINLTDIIHSERGFAAIGLAAAAADFLNIRAGALIKSSGTRLTLGAGLSFPGIDLDLTYAVDLLTQLKIMNRLSLAARVDLGDDGRGQRKKRTEELYIAGIANFAEGDYNDALSNFNEALELTPDYSPILKAKQTILDSMQLDTRVESEFTLE